MINETTTTSTVQTTPVVQRDVSFTSMETTSAPITNVLPAEVEIREKPAVVQEVIKPGVREEIQPVIHREREQLEIREQIQPIYEKSVAPTIVEQRQLAPEVRGEVRLGEMPVIAEGPRSAVVIEAEQREAVMHAPIIEETIHKKIIEEVQPVIHREVVAPKVIRETQPIYEKIVEAPVVSYSTLPPKYVGETMAAPMAMPMEGVTTTTTVIEKEFIPFNKTNNTTQSGFAPNTIQKF